MRNQTELRRPGALVASLRRYRRRSRRILPTNQCILHFRLLTVRLERRYLKNPRR